MVEGRTPARDEVASVDLAAVRAALPRLQGLVERTPLLRNATLSERLGVPVFLKAEVLQRTGSFKIRGAVNRMAALSEAERRRGVVAASAGNHAQGVALAASLLGVPCTIVMPAEASLPKVEATRRYGAEVLLEGEDFAACAELALRMAGERGLVLIHAFDDPLVIAGQGTLGLELVEELPEVETVVVPVGGGGLAAGVGLAVKSLQPRARVVGVQVEAAPGTGRAWRSGRIEPVHPSPTLADGIAVAAPGRHTLPLLQRHVDEMVLVNEESVASAILLLLEEEKLVVEGAGAVGVTALLSGEVRPRGTMAVVLSGGNIDVLLLQHVIEHGLSQAGRFQDYSLVLADRPGQLARVLTALAATGGNVLAVEHRRAGPKLPLNFVEIGLFVETRDHAHAEEITASLQRLGFRLDTTRAGTVRLRPAGG